MAADQGVEGVEAPEPRRRQRLHDAHQDEAGGGVPAQAGRGMDMRRVGQQLVGQPQALRKCPEVGQR